MLLRGTAGAHQSTVINKLYTTETNEECAARYTDDVVSLLGEKQRDLSGCDDGNLNDHKYMLKTRRGINKLKVDARK